MDAISLHRGILQRGPRGEPDGTARGTIPRFAEALTREFTSNPAIRKCTPDRRRLTVAFVGYLDLPRPCAVSCIISNFQSYNPLRNSAGASDVFSAEYFEQTLQNPIAALPVGALQTWRVEDQVSLDALLLGGAPARALIAKGVEMIREAARRDTHNSIGEAVTSILVPHRRGDPIDCAYHPDGPTSKAPMPAVIRIGRVASRPHMLTNIEIGQLGSEVPPVLVKKVASRRPCPCGSGKRFKHCHGRREREFHGVTLE